MKSLFLAVDCDRIVERVESLGADTRPQWGKMSSAQALEHCCKPLEIALGDVPMRRSLLGRLLGRLARGAFTNDKPFKRNLPTDPRFTVADEVDFAASQARILGLVRRFQSGGAEGLTRSPHPFFGPMTPPQWDVLMWKHLDHHLRQFGA